MNGHLSSRALLCTDAETLIKNADTAMYSAKENGRNSFRFFTEDVNALAVGRLTSDLFARTAPVKNRSFAALASTKLPSTDNCLPCTNPTSTHYKTLTSEPPASTRSSVIALPFFWPLV
jgi:hypothetical protein